MKKKETTENSIREIEGSCETREIQKVGKLVEFSAFLPLTLVVFLIDFKQLFTSTGRKKNKETNQTRETR